MEAKSSASNQGLILSGISNLIIFQLSTPTFHSVLKHLLFQDLLFVFFNGRNFSKNLIMALEVMTMIVFINYFAILPLIPVLLLFVWFRSYYVRSANELKRLENLCKTNPWSPMMELTLSLSFDWFRPKFSLRSCYKYIGWNYHNSCAQQPAHLAE